MNRPSRTASDRATFLVTALLLAMASTFLVVRLVAVAGVLSLQDNGTWQNPGPWVDWRTYANAFDRLTAGRGIYAADQLHGSYQLTKVVLIGYAYPPASVPLFAPFASYPFGLAAWLTLNLGLVFTALWALLSRVSRRHRGVLFAGMLAVFAMYAPFVIGVVSANVNVAIAGLIGWVALGVSSSCAAVLGAVGAVTKVFSAVLALGTERKQRSVIVATILVFGTTALTLPIVGLQSWIDFGHAMASSAPDCYLGNLSIACTLAPLVGIRIATAAGILVGGGAAVLALAVRDRLWLALLTTIAMIAPVTNLHVHYWIAAPVLAVAALERLLTVRRDRLGLAVTRVDKGLPVSEPAESDAVLSSRP